MEKQEIVVKVVQVIAQVQELSGRPSKGIDANTRPIGDVEGFDSLSGVEATVVLSETLGIELGDDYNPFISEDGKRALSVDDIAENLRAVVRAEAR